MGAVADIVGDVAASSRGSGFTYAGHSLASTPILPIRSVNNSPIPSAGDPLQKFMVPIRDGYGRSRHSRKDAVLDEGLLVGYSASLIGCQNGC